MSAFDSSYGRGGCGWVCRGSGRHGHQSGCGFRRDGQDGRGGRDGASRGDRRLRMNNIDVTDQHRNFTSDEWKSVVLVFALMCCGCAMLRLAVASTAMVVVEAW